MKLFTLIGAFFTIALNAQTFPAPYCDIDDDGTTVEEITSVTINETIITNTDTSSILVDKTDVFTFFENGEEFTISVTGNTVGDFDNDIIAFIDWNGNEVLDDENEVYAIGTLTNSNGADGVAVSLTILPDEDALFEPLRVRIAKIYKDEDSPAEIDPCAISFNPFGQGVFPGFGQALDFEIANVFVNVDEFDLNALKIYPNPTTNTLLIQTTVDAFDLITITDLQGRLVQTYSNPTVKQLDVSSFPSGVYFLNLKVGGKSINKKFVKR